MIEFTFTSPLVIEESTKDFKTVELTLVSEGISKHGIQYTLDNMEIIAETAINKPIFYGTDIFGKHDAPPLKIANETSGENYSGEPPIGKIVKAWVDKKLRKVKAIAHIWGQVKDLVTEGWGISIRGITETLKPIIKAGKRIFRAIKTRIQDIQLLSPETPRGVEDAKVNVVSESMEFSNIEEIIAVVSVLQHEGFV